MLLLVLRFLLLDIHQFKTEIWPQQTFRVVAGFIHNKPWARMLWRGGLVRMWDATGFQRQTTGIPISKGNRKPKMGLMFFGGGEVSYISIVYSLPRIIHYISVGIQQRYLNLNSQYCWWKNSVPPGMYKTMWTLSTRADFWTINSILRGMLRCYAGVWHDRFVQI